MVNFMARPIYFQERTPVLIEWEEAWTSEQFWRRENSLLLLGFEPQTLQPKASCYTDYAILAGKDFHFKREDAQQANYSTQ